ncbi:MAG: glycosyltransferase family 39 protein [Planctomycetota bacterium]
MTDSHGQDLSTDADPKATAPSSAQDASSNKKSDRRWHLALIALCVLVTLGTGLIVHGGKDALGGGRGTEVRVRDGVRNPDEAAYAQQAESILDRGELTNDFIRHFHVKKSSDITHREDFYPPGNGALIALSWLVFGRSDAASTYPSIVFACLLLPLLAAFLARRLGASWPFSFGAAVLVLFDPLIRFQSIQGLADIPLTGAILCAAVCAVRPRGISAMGSGAALALGFWFKPAAILFVPALALAVFLARPGKRLGFSFKRRVGHVIAFGFTFLLLASPWMLRNTAVLGSPLYSGNQYLTASANDENYSYEYNRRVFWPEATATDDPNAKSDNEGKDDTEARGFVQSVLANPAQALDRFQTHLLQVVEFHGASMFGWAFLVAALAFVGDRRIRSLTALCLAYVLALSAVFAIEDRYLMPLFPVAAAMTFLLAHRVADVLRATDPANLPGAWLLSRPGRIAICLSVVAALPQGLPFAKEVWNGKTNFVPPNDGVSLIAADWAAENLPDHSVVMANEALRFHHRTGFKTVNTPWDVPEKIEQVVRHYRIDYIVRTLSGDSTAISNRKLRVYLREFGDRWERVPVKLGRFEVYRRK